MSYLFLWRMCTVFEIHARLVLDCVVGLTHTSYSRAKPGAQCCWQDLQSGSRSMALRWTLTNRDFFSLLNVSGIKGYWGWWGWRWGGRGWLDPASSSVCTKKSDSRVQAGLSWNIPGNKTPYDYISINNICVTTCKKFQEFLLNYSFILLYWEDDDLLCTVYDIGQVSSNVSTHISWGNWLYIDELKNLLSFHYKPIFHSGLVDSETIMLTTLVFFLP